MPESPLSPSAARQSSVSSLLSHSDTGGNESAANGASCRETNAHNWHSLQHRQLVMAMMAPQQQLLTPNQLQALLQHKQQALLLQQQHLKDFYKGPSSQQWVFQQLLQLQQQQLVQRPVSSSALPPEIHQIWKELLSGITEAKFIDNIPPEKYSSEHKSPTSDPKSVVKVDSAHTLFSHGVCLWPGCDAVCDDFSQFIKHMDSDHSLDDKTTAQCRVQRQVVQQLHVQLCKEKKRLQAMMSHLRLPSLEVPPAPLDKPADPLSAQVASVLVAHKLTSVSLDSAQTLDPESVPSESVLSESVLSESVLSERVLSESSEEEAPDSPCTGAIRQHPLVYSLSSEKEYELYKNTDIRPPFTYATLIRQAIMEAADMQLTLNEIYNWFTRTFAYFRRNAATWKNAVRHNLSLHKCFVRVENVKGAVWTVDEVEYQRRRSQKITGTPALIQ
ncbi:forkhead box protein P1-like [Periophthalmus magnuspinnatus]|uniref:forkhead box protein P1-like n=1 Tax=Periophthalmus magnuspinnatus TaxID=409849 RepID=UPI0024362D54|nr:forkhead box protein P1-like [Periophthalmus magnuspinnatus]